MTDTRHRDAGSGKTTLLNTLAGRLQDGRDGATVKGRVLLNNRVAAADQIKRAVGATIGRANAAAAIAAAANERAGLT